MGYGSVNDRFIDFYMDIAERTASLSRAIRLKVGSILVKDNRIISIGFNGTPAGWDNSCEVKVYDSGAGGWITQEEFDEKYPHEEWDEGAQRNVRYGLKTKAEVIHAEANSISKLASSHESGKGADMFITHAPCVDCAKLIYGAGINRVFYRHAYRDQSGLEFLHKCNIEVIHHEKRT
jgi:dCMP deaminase